MTQKAQKELHDHLFSQPNYHLVKAPVEWIISKKQGIEKYFNNTEHPPDTYEGIVCNYLASSYETFSSINAILWVGCEMDATASLRILLESLIGLSYLNKGPEQRVKLFIEYADIKTLAKLEQYEKEGWSLDDRLTKEESKSIKSKGKAALRNRRKLKIERENSWSGKGVYVMAKEVEKLTIYRHGYGPYSHAVHVDQLRLRTYTRMKGRNTYSSPGFSTLAVACFIMSDIFREADKILKIGLNPDQLDKLLPSKEEFKK